MALLKLHRVTLIVLVFLITSAGCSARSTPASSSLVEVDVEAVTTPSGYVTFWVDDGTQSTYDTIFPAFASRGWVGVAAIVANRAIANEKFSWDGMPVMSWEQVRELVEAGWEISSHSMTHSHLNSMDGPQGLETEISGSRKSLENLGFIVPSFACPYGECGDQGMIAENFLYWRSSTAGVNSVPSNRHLTAYFVNASVDHQVLEGWIKETEKFGGWLIIGLHAVMTEPQNEWQHSQEQFEMVIRTVENSSLEVVLPNQVFARHGYVSGDEPHGSGK